MNTARFCSLVLSLAVALYSVGCAAPGNQRVPMPNQSVRIQDPTKARIYVFRDSIRGYTFEFTVHDNGKTVGEIATNSYLCWERPPGSVAVSAILLYSYPTHGFDAKAGGVYYLYLRNSVLGESMNEVSEQEAQELFKHCKPVRVVPGET